jgi:hypothetical protein
VFRKLLVALVVLFVVGSIITVTSVSATPVGGGCVEGVEEAGILPSSTFYFAKSWGRTVRSWFAFAPEEKAQLSLKFASEDVLAIDELSHRGEYIVCAKHCPRVEGHLRNALGWMLRAEREGENMDSFFEGVKESHICHQYVLADALSNTPEWARESILVAIQRTSAILAMTVEQMEGRQERVKFWDQLVSEFDSMNEETRMLVLERLETVEADVETSSGPAMGAAEAPQTEAAAGNSPPTILALEPEDDLTKPEHECQVECKAEDSDGDELAYEWSVSGGELSGSGATVTWVAPKKEGSYDISIVVTDGQGAEARSSVTVRVKHIDPPEIRHLIIIPRSKFLQYMLGRFVILQGRSCDIECPVDYEGRKLHYDWQADRGEFTGDGPAVTWDAPSGVGEVIVSVTVSDRYGSTDTKSVLFELSNCARCFPDEAGAPFYVVD